MRGLGCEAHATIVQHTAVVQQIRNEQGDAGVPADERLGVLVYRRVNADVGVAFQKLGAKRALRGERQTELVALKLYRAPDILDEDGDAVQTRDHGRAFSAAERE